MFSPVFFQLISLVRMDGQTARQTDNGPHLPNERTTKKLGVQSFLCKTLLGDMAKKTFSLYFLSKLRYMEHILVFSMLFHMNVS